jgi:hypothetical protein
MPSIRRAIPGLLIFSALSASLSSPVFAECAVSHAIVSPPSGSTVPADPTLYFFWPQYDPKPPKLKAHGPGGAALVIEQTALAKVESFTTYRLRVKANKPGAIVLELGDRQADYGPKSWRYTVSADWQPPAPAKSGGALQVKSQSSRWTCSYQLTQNIALPGRAAAYRVSIFSGNSNGKSRPAQELYVPPRMMQFFERDEEPAPSEYDQLELGHINCFGHTFAWQGQPILIDIFALQPDGSESRVTAARMRVDSPVAPGKGTSGHAP